MGLHWNQVSHLHEGETRKTVGEIKRTSQMDGRRLMVYKLCGRQKEEGESRKEGWMYAKKYKGSQSVKDQGK